MGTWVVIEANARSTPAAAAAVDAAYAAVLEIERRMHPQREGSDLAKLNCAPLHEPISVDASTCELLRLAKRLNDLTGGVFDPCLPCRPGRLADVELGPEPLVVCHATVALDFGGFAKGYAVDRAIDALARHGCISGCVNAGGDLRFFGPEKQAVLLRCPDGSVHQIELANTALAVSALDAGNRPPEHRGYYIRGRDQSPQHCYAAVLAEGAAIADALVKCVLLCPAEGADRALREFGASRVGID
jgi:thiamine biosynthesis lipoprotein